MSEYDQKAQTSTGKINKFWRYNTQHGDHSEQYCIVYSKVAEREDLKTLYHKKKMVTMGGDGY